MSLNCEKGCQPDYGQLLTKDVRCGGCESHPTVCCTPEMGCIDVEVKAFGDTRKECGPCKKEEAVFCYKVINNGPGCATNVVLKAFFCPEPRKICVVTKDPTTRFTYKNGILTVCIDRIMPCEDVDVEVTIKEQCESKCPCKFFEHEEECCEKEKKEHLNYETTAFVEAKEEDICVCNNVDFASIHHHPRPKEMEV